MLTSAIVALALAPCTVQSVDERITFAGKLRRRVELTLVVAEGRVVKVAPYHTRVQNPPRLQAGDRVLLPANRNWVSRDEIQLVKSETQR